MLDEYEAVLAERQQRIASSPMSIGIDILIPNSVGKKHQSSEIGLHRHIRHAKDLNVRSTAATTALLEDDSIGKSAHRWDDGMHIKCVIFIYNSPYFLLMSHYCNIRFDDSYFDVPRGTGSCDIMKEVLDVPR